MQMATMIEPGSDYEARLNTAIHRIVQNIVATQHPDHVSETKAIANYMIQLIRKLRVIGRKQFNELNISQEDTN